MLAEVRKTSEAVFGAPYRLEVIAAVGRLTRDAFTTRELQALLEPPLDSDMNAGRTLKKLEEAGLVAKTGALWHRRESPLWEFGSLWFDTLLADNQPRPRQRPRPRSDITRA